MSDARAAAARPRRRRAVLKLTFVAIAIVAIAAYTMAARAGSMGPGDAGSRAFGIAALVALLASALYAGRRRTIHLIGGSVAGWLDAHLYLGALTCLLVLLHGGLRLPSGFLTWTLWLSTVWLTISGLVGRLLQVWIPRALTSGLTTEVLYERIPEIVAANAARAERIADRADQDIRRFYTRRLADALATPRFRLIFLADITGGGRTRVEEFRYLAERFVGEERETLRELEALYRAKLELDAHHTLQRLLRVWPLTHVPVAVLLLALSLAHVLSVIYY